MKIVKRALIGILAAAVLVSGLLLSISAEHTLESYGDIIKYYDPATSQLYASEDFEGDGYVGSVNIGDNAEGHTEISVTAEDDAALKVALGHILNTQALTDATYGVSIPEGRRDLVIRYSFSASHTDVAGAECTSCLASYSVAAGETAPETCQKCGEPLRAVSSQAPIFNMYICETAPETLGTAVLSFDFRSGKVVYTNGSSNGEIEGLVLAEDAWYSVEVLYVGNLYSATVSTVVDNKDVQYTITDAIAPTISVKGVALGFGIADDNRCATFSIDDVYVQAGTEDLVTGVDRAALTDEAMSMINDVLVSTTSTIEERLQAIDTFELLTIEYADVLEVKTETADTIASINTNILLVYSEALNECVDAINTASSYPKRLAHITQYEEIASRVGELILGGYVNDDAAADLALYNAEVAALEGIKANTEVFITAIAELRSGLLPASHPLYGYETVTFGTTGNVVIFSSDVYSELKDFTTLVDATYTYDPTYPGVADAHDIYNTARARFITMDTSYKLFVEAVATAIVDHETSTEITLTDRLSAYAFAVSDEGYFDNETCPGVTEALADLETLNELKSIRLAALIFLDQVSSASASEYLPAKMELVTEAYENYDTVNDAYPGVAEAKAELDDMDASIKAMKAAAAAYIAAVDALDLLEGDELVDGIAAALELQRTGNIHGIEGVSAANIKLNSYKTNQEYVNGIANKFIRLVNMIDDTSTLAVRFDAIKAAREAELLVVDDTVDGVFAAKSKLMASISLFNSDIEAVNSCYKSVVSNAADLAGAANSFEGIFGMVITFIKGIAG